MSYQITKQDREKINEIIFSVDLTMSKDYVKSCFDNCESYGNNELENLKIIYTANNKILTKIYDYFIDNKLTNPFLFLQNHLISSRSYAYNKDHVDFFTNGVKAKKYIPESQKISKIIHHSFLANKGLMHSLIKLSLVTPDEDERATNFLHLIREKKNYQFDSNEKEQFKKIWGKYFTKNTQQKYEHQFFDVVPPEKNLSYIEEESGHFYSVIVDCDKLSITNNISHNRNASRLVNFFRNFILYISENPDNFLSIKNVELKSRDTNLAINKKEIFVVFKDESYYQLHKKVINELVENCFSMSDQDLTNISENNYFQSYLLNYKLNQELKSSKATSNKNKI